MARKEGKEERREKEWKNDNEIIYYRRWPVGRLASARSTTPTNRIESKAARIWPSAGLDITKPII